MKIPMKRTVGDRVVDYICERWWLVIPTAFLLQGFVMWMGFGGWVRYPGT